jgi:PleD family two-component response regulator
LLFGRSRATVSVGVASWRAGLDREALLRLARGAMTEAYRQGGNRVSAAVTT